MKTEKVAIGNLREHYDRFIDILDDFIFRTGIREKNAFRFTLLAEEAVRLAESIVGSGEYVDIWLEGDSDTAYIYLNTDQKLDTDQQEEFISVSSSGKNEAPRTFFDYIREKFEKPEKSTWSLMEYEEDLKAKKERRHLFPGSLG